MSAAILKSLALAAVTSLAVAARADQPTINPYRLYWSFPTDDKTAIEIDDPDLSVSVWETRWQFARAMQSCDQKQSQKLSQRRDKSVREVRIEALDGNGEVRTTTRCVMTNRAWRVRLGARLFERLEEELDAHEAFLHPRSYPGMPAAAKHPPVKPPEPSEPEPATEDAR